MVSMNCRRARNLLFDFFDGASNEALRAEVDRHLGECEECDHFASEMTQSLALLRRAPVESLDDNFNWKVRLAIHREKNSALERAASANAWVRAWNVRYAVSSGLAFGAVLVVGGMLLFRGGGIAPVQVAKHTDSPVLAAHDVASNPAAPVGRSTFHVPVNNGLMSTVSAGNSNESVGPAPMGAIDETRTDARIDSLINSDVSRLSAQEREQYYQRRIDWLQSKKIQQRAPQH
jgi:anti-sigma factor RsiW